MHGALNLLLLRGPIAGKISTLPTFHQKSHGAKLGLGRGGGGGRTWMFCSFRKVILTLALWAWRYHEGEGSYGCQRFSAADVLILLLRLEQFQHSMLL